MQNQNVNPTVQAVYTQTQVNGQYYQNQGYPQAQNAAQYYQNAVYQQMPQAQQMMAPQSFLVKNKKKHSFSLAALICTIIAGAMLLISVIMSMCRTSAAYELNREQTKMMYERVEDKEPYDAKKYAQKQKALDEKRKQISLDQSDAWEKFHISNQLRELFGILFLASAIWLIVSKKQASSDK